MTRWEQEQFSRGSYSFVAPGANGDDYAKLAAPVHDSNNRYLLQQQQPLFLDGSRSALRDRSQNQSQHYVFA